MIKSISNTNLFVIKSISNTILFDDQEYLPRLPLGLCGHYAEGRVLSVSKDMFYLCLGSQSTSNGIHQ